LLLAAQRGDVSSLDRFVAETQGEVWNLCRYLGDARDADDLAQEVYERAIAALPRYRGDGPARGWLLTIARRVCADHVRKAQRRRRNDAAVLQQAHVDPAMSSDTTVRVDLDDLLARLDDDRRVAFVLTQVLGMYYDEAAEVIGCPVGTVRSRVSRARLDLASMTAEASGSTTRLGRTGTNPA
jgi:RNA polymerase sigma-70 factor (ECF subfamily)